MAGLKPYPQQPKKPMMPGMLSTLTLFHGMECQLYLSQFRCIYLKAFKEWLKNWGDDQKLNPYHLQTNGMTEGFKGIIQKIFLKSTGGNPHHWTEFLSKALYTYRTIVNYCPSPKKMRTQMPALAAKFFKAAAHFFKLEILKQKRTTMLIKEMVEKFLLPCCMIR